MRSEFEKLFESQRSYRSSDKEAFIRGCEAAFKHQQSKVDELQVLYTQQGVNMLKLQKREDELRDRIGSAQYTLEELSERLLDNPEAQDLCDLAFLTLTGEQALKGGEP